MSDEINRLREENALLKYELEKLDPDFFKSKDNVLKQDDVVFGFKIKLEKHTATRYKSDGTKEKKVSERYYAKRKIRRKAHRVYIGYNLSRSFVEDKVKAYIERHKLHSLLDSPF